MKLSLQMTMQQKYWRNQKIALLSILVRSFNSFDVMKLIFSLALTAIEKRKMIKTENFEQVVVENQAALREWLLEHHQQEASVWLVTYKKVKKKNTSPVKKYWTTLVFWLDRRDSQKTRRENQ